MNPMTRKPQRGGFAIGLIIGLLIGLALALGVALYVTKVPIPFVNKVPQRTADQDAAETQKNKNWDPNSPLSGKNPARPNAGASGPLIAPATGLPSTTTPQPPVTATAPAVPPATRDPGGILADRPAPAASRPGATAGGIPAVPGLDPFVYFVQAGAFGKSEDAEQQRAKLAMLGLESKLTEREQSGRTVFRVRLGPFDRKAEADSTKEKLTEAGIESALVRVQR
jgi:cell division protein FtsN